MISVVINTLNEARNLPNALASVKSWADEIVVVDMHSDDGTVAIAEAFGARVFPHERIEAFDRARKFAVEQARGDWILLLDADEMVPPPLAAALLRHAAAASADILRIARENYLLGGLLRHTGWGPEQDRLPRFFRRGAMIFSDRIHAFMTPAPASRQIDLPYGPGLALVHFNYVDMSQFVAKMNRYTSIEAAQLVERGLRRGPLSLARALVSIFWERYVAARGYKDGWRGFVLSATMVFYEFLIFAKVEELHRAGTAPVILEAYRRIAAETLGDGAPTDPPR